VSIQTIPTPNKGGQREALGATFRLKFRLIWIWAVVYMAMSMHPVQANHVHMQGGPFMGVVLAIAVDPTDPRNLYVAAHGGGVFHSTDQAASWTAFNDGLPNKQVFSLVFHAKRRGRIYLGTDQGIFFSDRGDKQWRPLSKDLDQRNIRALAADPADPNVLFAATDRGVFTGQMSRWRRATIGIATDDVRALSINPGRTVFAATFAGMFSKPKSADRWQEVNNGLSDKHVRTLSLDPRFAETVYAGTATGGVFRTVNGGKNWREFNRGLLNSTVLSLMSVPLPEQPVYAGTIDGIFKSIDGKNQWYSIGPDLPYSVSAMAYNPMRPRQLYAGSGGRLYFSHDAGANWRESSYEINYFGNVSHRAMR